MLENRQLSALEVAYDLMKVKKNPQPIKKIIEEVLQIKGIDDVEGDIAASLYVDITLSSKFVFLGNDCWDLKERHSLAEWDKDGSAYNSGNEEEEDEISRTVSLDDYVLPDDLGDNEDEDDEDEIEEIDVEEDFDLVEEDDDDDDDYLDEEKYNDIMDDYEDMYEN